jgi:hypothetical protein
MGLAGYSPSWRDGSNAGRWILLDYLDIVVVVQHESKYAVGVWQGVSSGRKLIQVRPPRDTTIEVPVAESGQNQQSTVSAPR